MNYPYKRKAELTQSSLYYNNHSELLGPPSSGSLSVFEIIISLPPWLFAIYQQNLCWKMRKFFQIQNSKRLTRLICTGFYLFLYINNYVIAAFVYLFLLLPSSSLRFVSCRLRLFPQPCDHVLVVPPSRSCSQVLAIKFFQPILVANKHY